jgi:hypothetical protein
VLAIVFDNIKRERRCTAVLVEKLDSLEEKGNHTDTQTHRHTDTQPDIAAHEDIRMHIDNATS